MKHRTRRRHPHTISSSLQCELMLRVWTWEFCTPWEFGLDLFFPGFQASMWMWLGWKTEDISFLLNSRSNPGLFYLINKSTSIISSAKHEQIIPPQTTGDLRNAHYIGHRAIFCHSHVLLLSASCLSEPSFLCFPPLIFSPFFLLEAEQFLRNT